MPALYATTVVAPEVWRVSGAGEGKTIVELKSATPLHWSDGTVDMLPANSPALTSTTTPPSAWLNRTLDMWCIYTVKGSGALSACREADVLTLAGDYVGLLRLDLHTDLPYQQS